MYNKLDLDQNVAIANALGIKGNVQNLVDERVKIVAEGEGADLVSCQLSRDGLWGACGRWNNYIIKACEMNASMEKRCAIPPQAAQSKTHDPIMQLYNQQIRWQSKNTFFHVRGAGTCHVARGWSHRFLHLPTPFLFTTLYY